MTLSPRLRVYTALAATALIGALAFGRPDLAVLATPFVVLLGAAFTGAPLALDGRLELERERVLEGESVRATLTVHNRGAAARVGVGPPQTERLPTRTSSLECWVPAGEHRGVAFELTVERWGLHVVGPVAVRAHDRLGAFTLERTLGGTQELRAYPRVDRLQRLVAPLRNRPVLGSQVSRERGEGIEFADLRPLVPGDRVRSINWRASARRGVPYVNVHHPEHSADVVLFLDTFAEAERAEAGTLDAAVHAAAALASRYLTRRDRVALVSFGGVVSWLAGSPGTRQLYRIVDALLESHVKPSFRWTDITHVPGHLLPARALVLGLSPLLDERGLGALLDLRARGYDLAVIEISPLALDDAGSHELPLRLWRLQREALRARFERLGVPVARWDRPHTDLDLVIEEVIASRRHARAVPRV
ncbi:MAG TPA: DUF58 domain-containing protein [Solirubrobacteraceae bacterium]|nr:DUF58 domain-containing protein [Solirubrobacteraceae bacterium]